MSSINSNTFRRISLAAMIVLAQPAIVACGGGGSPGGGGGNPTSKAITIDGQLNNSASRAAVKRSITRSLLPNTTINAYVWSDLKDIIATSTTNSNGDYTITVPGTDAGMTIVLEATTVSAGVTTRYSTIVTGLIVGAITNADIDPATSLAAEMDSAAALVLTPIPANLSGSAFATITSEFSNWSGISGVDLTVGGQNLLAAFGSGLNHNGPAYQFASGDTVTQSALANLADTGSVTVAGARSVVQMARSLLSGLLDDGVGEQTSLTAAVNSQSSTVNTTMQGISAFTQRAQTVFDTIGSNSSVQGLHGFAPGNYQLIPNTGTKLSYAYILNQTGPSADGKSWVVTFAEGTGTPTNGLVMTITPKNAIPAFEQSGTFLTAGSFTFSVSSATDASVKYNGTLTATADTSTSWTMALNASFSDVGLTQPITVTGTITGTPDVGGGNPDHVSSYAVNVSLTSQFGATQVTNLGYQDFTDTQVKTSSNLKSISLGSFTAQDSLTPSAQVSLTGVTIDFATPIAADGTNPVLSSVAFTLADLKASGYELKLTNGSMTFVRSTNAPTRAAPSAIQGTASYTSPELTISGSINGTWSNATTNNNGTLAQFPQGSLTLKGTVTPVATGNTYGANLTLAGSVNGTNGVATLTVNSITEGSETLTGSATATYSSTGGNVSNQAAWNVTLTQQPTGDVVTLSGTGNNLTGNIKTASGTTEANIGGATSLGLPDLGNITIIKYIDGTFETAASILP